MKRVIRKKLDIYTDSLKFLDNFNNLDIFIRDKVIYFNCLPFSLTSTSLISLNLVGIGTTRILTKIRVECKYERDKGLLPLRSTD